MLPNAQLLPILGFPSKFSVIQWMLSLVRSITSITTVDHMVLIMLYQALKCRPLIIVVEGEE